MQEKNQLIISLTDLIRALRQGKKALCIVSLVCAAMLFFYQLKKPIHYTAKGVFKSTQTTSSSGLSKALEFLGASESYNPEDDPKFFMRSYPVMERVVRVLNLQVKIHDKSQKKGKLAELLTTWKAERWHKRLKKIRPDAEILSSSALVLKEPFYKTKEPLLKCGFVDYPGLLCKNLAIKFLDKQQYEVWEGKKRLGRGILGELFVHSDVKWILNSAQKNLKRKTFGLTLLPMGAIAKSLEDLLVVKRDKENPSLFHISFTHKNPHLAEQVVNQTMCAFQDFLKEEGKLKIAKQLGYLKQRQKEAVAELEVSLEQYKIYLQEHVGSGGIVALEHELEFFAEMQEEHLAKLRSLSSDIEEIKKAHPAFAAYSFAELSNKINELYPQSLPKTLLKGAAETLISNYQSELDHILYDKSLMDQSALKLADPDFACMAACKLLSDPALKERFENIHKIEKSLIDEKNFSEKERASLKSQLETEKDFLLKKLALASKGAEVQVSLIQERILALYGTLLSLLYTEHESVQKALDELNEKAKHFPEKWLSEQKINLNTKIHFELLETLSKVIETKNIGYHLEYSHSHPLMMASLPLMPDHPKLFFGFILGALVGAGFSALFIILKEITSGASASSINLLAFGKEVLGTFIYPTKKRERQTIKKLVYFLTLKNGPFFILSKFPNRLADHLADAFLDKGKQIKIFQSFERFKESEKGSELVLVNLTADPQSFEVKEVLRSSYSFIYLVHDEKLKDLGELPKHTFFVLADRKEPPFTRKSSFKQIVPLLKNLKERAFAHFNKI